MKMYAGQKDVASEADEGFCDFAHALHDGAFVDGFLFCRGRFWKKIKLWQQNVELKLCYAIFFENRIEIF